MLAEAEHFDPFLVEDDSARVVGALAARREFGQIIHLVFQLGVTVQLREQHFVGGQRVGFGRVGLVELFPAIEFVSGHERALLHLVEDILHVDETAFVQVYVESGTQKLFDEYRNVEFVRVVASEVASFDVSPQRFGDLAESGAVGDILVVDVVDGRGGLRNVHLRVDPARLDFLAAVGHYFDER